MSHDRTLSSRLDRLERVLAANAGGLANDGAAEVYLRARFGDDPTFAPHLDALCAALLSGQPRYEFTAPNARDPSHDDRYFVFWQRDRDAAAPVVIVLVLPEPEPEPPEDE